MSWGGNLWAVNLHLISGHVCGGISQHGRGESKGDRKTWRGTLPAYKSDAPTRNRQVPRTEFQKLECCLPLCKCLFHHISTRIKGHFNWNSKAFVGLVEITWVNCTAKCLHCQVLVPMAFTGTLKESQGISSHEPENNFYEHRSYKAQNHSLQVWMRCS